MGHWGSHPWQNDSALDWLDKFAAEAQLNQQIDTGLNLPLEQIDEIRAAAHLLLTLSSSDVQFVLDSAPLLKLAQTRLLEAIEAKLFTNRQFILQVLGEVTALKAAVSRQGQPGKDSHSPIDGLIEAGEQFGLTLYTVADVEGDIPESRARDVVGTGFLDGDAVLHVQLEDGRPDGFLLKFRCSPSDGSEFDEGSQPVK
jgi:hypothetical protein